MTRPVPRFDLGVGHRYRRLRDLRPAYDPLRHLLNRLAGTTGAPRDSLNRDGLEQARRFGWVYEFQGRVALTGAGVYHAGEISGGGRAVGGYKKWPLTL